MDIKINEYERAFAITFKAETLEDAQKLTRMGLNLKKETPYFDFDCLKDGSFVGYISMRKKLEDKSKID